MRAYSPAGSGWWRAFPQWVNIDEPNWAVTSMWGLGLAAVMVFLWRFGRGRSGTSNGEIDPDGGASVGRGVTGFRWAAATIVLLCGFVLVQHATVVLTDLHRSTSMDAGVVAWVVEELPQRGWAEPGGVWVSPGRPVDLVLVTGEPLATLDVSLRVLVAGDVAAWVGAARLAGGAAPGANLVARLEPGEARRTAVGYAYACRLVATAGASPATLTGDADERYLGVFFQVTGQQRGNPAP